MHWHCGVGSSPRHGSARPGSRVPRASVCCHSEMRVGSAHDGGCLKASQTPETIRDGLESQRLSSPGAENSRNKRSAPVLFQ